MLDDAYLTAPDGPITPDVHLTTGWSWLVFAVGAGIVAVGALLQSPGSLDPPAPPVTLSR